jgi:hypothetical protein
MCVLSPGQDEAASPKEEVARRPNTARKTEYG